MTGPSSERWSRAAPDWASALWRADWWPGQRALAKFVRHTQTEWVRAGRVIHWGPVSASCTMSLPGWSGGKVNGALALVDGGLEFAGRHATVCDRYVPFEAVRSVALRRAYRWRAGARRLAVHAERSGRWQVAVFALDGAISLAEALSARTGCPLQDAGSGREDFGPALALRVREDIYGEWHADREDQLYLAPDRLLFGWRDAIPLESIEQISVLEYAPGEVRRREPSRGELLRIMQRLDEETYDVVGFRLARATPWAEAIAVASGGSLEIGRKKKPLDDPSSV